jgi:hypothetical protein
VVQAVVATLSGTSWRPRTRERAASASFWLVGAMFVLPVFAMGSGELGVALVVPALREPLSPWLSPARTRLVVWAVSSLAGLLSGLSIWWAAWLHFPLRSRAA